MTIPAGSTVTWSGPANTSEIVWGQSGANTRIVHNIRSKNNLEVLKQSSGDVTEEMWDSVPSLNPGQAIVNSPQFKNSLVVEVRHCRSKRIKQE